MNIRKIIGSITEPCGTPVWIRHSSLEIIVSDFNFCFDLGIRVLWHTFFINCYVASVHFFLSIAMCGYQQDIGQGIEPCGTPELTNFEPHLLGNFVSHFFNSWSNIIMLSTLSHSKFRSYSKYLRIRWIQDADRIDDGPRHYSSKRLYRYSIYMDGISFNYALLMSIVWIEVLIDDSNKIQTETPQRYVREHDVSWLV